MNKFNHFLRFALIVLLMFFALQGFAQEKTAGYQDYDLGTLKKIMQKGPFLAIDDTAPGKSKPATVGMMINATPERVWECINDCDGFTKHIPSVAKMELLEKGPNYTIVYFEVVVLKVGPINITTNYTIKNSLYKDDWKIVLSWVAGKVKNINGCWELIPIEGGKKTMAFYTASADYGQAAMGASFLFSRQPELMETTSLSGNLVIIRALKKWAESPPKE